MSYLLQLYCRLKESSLIANLKLHTTIPNTILADIRKIVSNDGQKSAQSRRFYQLYYCAILLIICRLNLFAGLIAIQHTYPELIRAVQSVDYYITFCFDYESGKAYCDPILLSTLTGVILFIVGIHYIIYYIRPGRAACRYLEEIVVKNIESLCRVQSDVGAVPLKMTFELWKPRKSVLELIQTIQCLARGEVIVVGDGGTNILAEASIKVRSALALIVILFDRLVKFDIVLVELILLPLASGIIKKATTNSTSSMLYTTIEAIQLIGLNLAIYQIEKTAFTGIAIQQLVSFTSREAFEQLHRVDIVPLRGSSKRTSYHRRLAHFRYHHTRMVHFVFAFNTWLISPGLSLGLLCNFLSNVYGLVFLSFSATTLPLFQLSIILFIWIFQSIGSVISTLPGLMMNESICRSASHLVPIIGKCNGSGNTRCFRSKWKTSLYYELLHRSKKPLAMTAGVFGAITRKSVVEFIFFYIAHILYFIGHFVH